MIGSHWLVVCPKASREGQSHTTAVAHWRHKTLVLVHTMCIDSVILNFQIALILFILKPRFLFQSDKKDCYPGLIALPEKHTIIVVS